MPTATKIDFKQYAQKLGADSSRLEGVFQKALDVAGMVRAQASESFADLADDLSSQLSLRLVVGSPKFPGNFATVDSTGGVVVCVEGLNDDLDSKVNYYHALGHALFHAEKWSDITKPLQEVLEEAEAEIFSIVVAIHDPKVSSESMLSYLTEWGEKHVDRNKVAFDTALAFFKDNWIALSPITLLETYGPALVLGVNDRLIHEVAKTPSRLNNITPADFEDLMAKVFAGLGYAVEQTKRTRDGGIDILAVKNIDDVSLRFLIECKRYAQGRQVGVSLVRELFGIKHHLGASKAIIATTSDFTKPAVNFAEAHRWELELKNRDGIVQWINSYLTGQTERTV
jgi:hypothetical protein